MTLKSSSLQWFPYDFRGEEIMSLVKHIVARCSVNKQLSDVMSDLLCALLMKLTELSKHEDEMKAYKRPLTEVSVGCHCHVISFSLSNFHMHRQLRNGRAHQSLLNCCAMWRRNSQNISDRRSLFNAALI